MRLKSPFFFVVSVGVFFQLVACGQFPNETVSTLPVLTQTPYPTYTPYPANTPYPTYTPYVSTTSADISFSNAPISLTVYFPGNYALVKGDEPNRRGSFLYYKFAPIGDFIPANNSYFDSQPPYFYEIQFFDQESIGNFLGNCAQLNVDGMPCFEGDFPDLERYNELKDAFQNAKNYDRYVFETYGNRSYLITTIGCGGGYCKLRQYTTFLNNTMVDVWILLDPNDVEAQTELSDKLFKSFYIEIH